MTYRIHKPMGTERWLTDKGCIAWAKAYRDIFGGKLFDVTEPEPDNTWGLYPGKPHHVVVRTKDGIFHDATGTYANDQELLSFWADRAAREGYKVELVLEPHNVKRAKDQGLIARKSDYADAYQLLKMSDGSQVKAATTPTFDLAGTWFHGTRHANVTSLKPSTGGEFGPGVYLTDFEPTAERYAQIASGPDTPTVLKVKVHAKKPFVITKQDWIDKTASRTPRTVQSALQKAGYDCILGVALNGYEKQLVVFDPSLVEVLSTETIEAASKRLALTPKHQQRMSQAEQAFKAWFKDSKVVDKEGKPLPVYHGTTKGGFTKFNPSGIGSYFTGTEDVASSYSYWQKTRLPQDRVSNGIYETFLSMQNPLVVDAMYSRWTSIPYEGDYSSTDEIAMDAQTKGHDGVIFHNVADCLDTDKTCPPSDVYVVFKPSQIKSVRNMGAWSEENEDITASLKACISFLERK
jgi:hypothetical protein